MKNESANSHGDQPLISVGIPTYNRPENLRRTLTEMTNQTYKNLDIIVSDNASPGTEIEEVLNEFMLTDQRIRYFKQTSNIGIQPNFQFVLAQARGEYFVWSSDDDWHKPTFVEELYNKLSRDSTAVVSFCDFEIRNEMGSSVENYPNPNSALRLMTAKNSIVRQVNFFLLAEGQAIPHAMYGLLPMRVMKIFSWTGHTLRYGEYGADTLFIFWLLGRGRLALVERNLFGCTVNNQKYYGELQRRSLTKKLRTVIQRINYLISFVKVAKGWNRLVLLSVFPWKLAEVLFSMMVREPYQKVMQVVKRHRLE